MTAFDRGYDDMGNCFDSHGMCTTNLISAPGQQAVLPPIGVNFYHVDNIRSQRNEWLLAKRACESFARKCKNFPLSKECQNLDCNSIFPSFINYSRIMTGPKPSWRKHNQQIIQSLERLLKNPPKSTKDCKTNFWWSYIAKVCPFFEDGKLSQQEKQKIREKIDNAKHVLKDTDYEVFKSLAPHSIVILASGNYGERSIWPIEAQASKELGTILVGSMDPNGDKSSFSQEDEELVILAPAGENIYSANSKGQPIKFGGTSASAPLVTGSLGAFEWLSGYHPKAEEAKLLLEKTAVPTKYSNDLPRRNGAGMLNAYKLGMVGQKLKKLCGKNLSCFKQRIKDPKTYDFPKEPGLEEEIESAFPECRFFSCDEINQNTCQDKASVFKKLRQSALLQANDKDLWAYLACIYKSNGFLSASQAVEKTYKALLEGKGNKWDKFCKRDADCVLVSDCQNPDQFIAISQESKNMYYATECTRNMCGDRLKCGCGPGKKRITKTKNNTSFTYSSKCRKNKCTLKVHKKPIEILPENTLEGEELEPDNSSTGQR